MKRFDFSLDKVKRFREAELRIQETRASMLRAAEAQMQQRVAALHTSYANQRHAVSRGVEIDGAQLEHLHRFSEFVSIEIIRLQKDCDALRQELDLQIGRVAACRQRVELLEKLRERERGRWNLESTKELQVAAEESFGARWLRERRPY